MSENVEILKIDSTTGRTYLRGVLTLAIFSKPPIASICEKLQNALDEFVKFIPKNILKWESIGASSEEWKPINSTSLQRCKNQLKKEAAAKRRLTSFELISGDVGGEASEYRIFVVGEPVEKELPYQRCLLQMTFPLTLEKSKLEDLITFVRKIAEIVPHEYGYLSPSLQWAELGQSRAIAESRAIALRYPGFDVQMNETGRTWLGTRVRGARWVTFLGSEILQVLGGLDSLRLSLPASVLLEPIGGGVMIRAGLIPEIGDKAQKQGTPLLNAVAKILEPVTAFEEVVLLGSLAKWDKDFLRWWERRFLDHNKQ